MSNNETAVTMVRIYITEGSKSLKPILEYLHNEAKIKGVSVFRAISGYGESGEHNATLIDVIPNLPLVIEFFDNAEKVEAALTGLKQWVKPEHIVKWQALAH